MVKKIKQFLFENTSARQTVAKNTIWLTVSNFGGRLIKAAIVIYGARVLDTAGYGVYSYALTLAGFVSLFLDPGINSILVRETAKASDEERMKVFSATLAIKSVLILIGVLIVIFLAPSFSTLPGTRALLPLVAFILSFDTFRNFFVALMDAREKMEWDAAVNLITNGAITIFGFWFLTVKPDALSFTWAYALGAGIGALVAFIIILPYLTRAISHFSLQLVLPILNAAWPFAAIGALGALLTNSDILIISWMKNAAEVGIYSAAIRIVQVIYVIPAIIQTATLPAFSRLAKKDDTRFRAGFERTLGFIFLASVPFALGGAILGTQVMALVFGTTYASGGMALKVLMVSLMFDFPASVIAAAIFAYNHQKGLIISSAIAGATNVALDLILIPRFGITGSAFATLGAQALSNWYLWHMMNKINPFSVVPRLGRIAAAVLCMAAVGVLLLFLHIPALLNIVVCTGVYAIMLLVLREPLLLEVKSLTKAAAATPLT